MDRQDRHLHETAYLTQVKKYLFEAYGKTTNEVAIPDSEILEGFAVGTFPHTFVDQHAKEWGIKMKFSFIPHSATRIVHV